MDMKRPAQAGLPTDAQGSNDSFSEVTSRADEKQVYRPEEIAMHLGLHANSVYSLLKSGVLPGVKAGRKWLISKRRFDAWLHGGGEE